MSYGTTSHHRRPVPRRRRFQGGLQPWTLAIGVLVLVVVVWLFQRSQSSSASEDAATIRQRSEMILGAMQGRGAMPSFDASQAPPLPPGDWTITAVDVVGGHGRILAAVGTPATPTRTTWELRWSKRLLGGWTCVEILDVNRQVAYDALGWQK
jgi:hypothetical protein